MDRISNAINQGQTSTLTNILETTKQDLESYAQDLTTTHKRHMTTLTHTTSLIPSKLSSSRHKTQTLLSTLSQTMTEAVDQVLNDFKAENSVVVSNDGNADKLKDALIECIRVLEAGPDALETKTTFKDPFVVQSSSQTRIDESIDAAKRELMQLSNLVESIVAFV